MIIQAKGTELEFCRGTIIHQPFLPNLKMKETVDWIERKTNKTSPHSIIQSEPRILQSDQSHLDIFARFYFWRET